MRRSFAHAVHGVSLLAPFWVFAAAAAVPDQNGAAADAEDAIETGVFPGMTVAPVRVGVTINGHWKGNSWLRIRDDGRPCALVSQWLEWGVAVTAPFVPDSDVAGHERCVVPDRPAPRIVAGTGADIAHRASEEVERDDEDDDDDDDELVVRVRFDAQHHQLKITADDAVMSRARGDVPFSRHDNGINAVRLDYQVSALQTTLSDDWEASRRRQTAVYATLSPGVNIGAWRARSTVQYTRDGSVGLDGRPEPRWRHDTSYVTRDIGRLRSRVTLGQTYTDALLFDSLPFTGAKMASEDSLLPDYLEAFTPVVRGYAKGNAQVLIRQNGVLFYHTTVAPGLFVLYDVRPPASSGDIRVTVQEADGSEHVSIVPYTAMPLLTHSRTMKYAVNAGRYRPLLGNDYPDAGFVQATAGYGLPGKVSLFGGLLASRDYRAHAAGVGWDLDIAGAVSLDVTTSQVVKNIVENQGRQWRMRYAKSFARSGTGISVDYRRYDRGHYRTLESNFARDAQFDFWADLVGPDEADDWVKEIKPRDQLRLEFKQNVGDTGSLYATLGHQRYADDTPTRSSAQVGLTWYGERFDLDVQANHTRSRVLKQTSAQLTLSVPFGGGSGTTQRYAFSAERDEEGKTTWDHRITGSALADYRLNYTLSQQRDSTAPGQHTDSARVSYQADAARWSLGYSHSAERQRADASLEGSIVAWSRGVVLGQPLGDTVGIIEAPGFRHSAVDGQLATRTDARGRAIVSYLTPYRVNRLGLDSLEMGDTYDFDSLYREVVPTYGAILIVPIKPAPMPAL